MRVRPMLSDWEIPRISGVRSLDRRTFAEIRIPGRAGSLLQDIGASPLRVEIRGSVYGDETRSALLDAVRGQFNAGNPVTFVADILTATDVQYVVIESLAFNEHGTRPDETDYVIVLKESPPPPAPPDPFGAIDTDLLDQAGSLLDSAAGALAAIDALANLPDIGDPTPPLRNIIDGSRTALESFTAIGGDLFELFGDPDA